MRLVSMRVFFLNKTKQKIQTHIPTCTHTHTPITHNKPNSYNRKVRSILEALTTLILYNLLYMYVLFPIVDQTFNGNFYVTHNYIQFLNLLHSIVDARIYFYFLFFVIIFLFRFHVYDTLLTVSSFDYSKWAYEVGIVSNTHKKLILPVYGMIVWSYLARYI